MRKIVAIGGGGETEDIDRRIIELSGKKKPKMLFVPTATTDSKRYWYYMDGYYGNYLGCKTDVLNLIREKNSKKEIKRKIEWADIIYIGGGNTLMMMKVWRKLGVDKLLKKAWEKGTVMCGSSAGAICWFQSGHSDSMSFYNPKKWEYINVKGLGLVKGIHCPHYDSHTLNVPRRKDFFTMMRKKSSMGIAIDENCAIEFLDDTFKVIGTDNAYQVFSRKSKIIEKKIVKEKKLPIGKLYLRK